MQITYELTQKDFTEAYTAHRNGKPLSKWSRRLFIWIVGFMSAAILFGFLIKPSVQEARGLAPFFALLVAWIAILWILPWWSMRRQFLGQPGARGTRTLTLDTSGAHWRWNGGSSDVEWKNYIRSVEGKNQILLYTSPVCFNILPKRAILPELVDPLRELLKQNIRAAK
jgi:hypothetical protein